MLYPGANDMTIACWINSPDVIQHTPASGFPISILRFSSPKLGVYPKVSGDPGFGFLKNGSTSESIAGFPWSHMGDNFASDYCNSSTHFWNNWRLLTIRYEDDVGVQLDIQGNMLEEDNHENHSFHYNSVGGLSLDTVFSNHTIKIGGDGCSFYIREIGIWHNKLTNANIVKLFNNNIPIDFATNSADGAYDKATSLKAYWRFGDGVGDNVASLLHDETNTDNSSVALDLNVVSGTIHQVDIGNV